MWRSLNRYKRVRVQTVSETWLYRNGFDPDFFDDTDMIECDTCGEEYDYKQYHSTTCVECESKLVERVKAIVDNCPTCNEREGK
jgi:hypothetical protein